MSLVIKGGTIVAADRTYNADVLVEGETIKAIGEGLNGDSTLDASGCFVMPGGIDPHTHLDMPFMGTNSADNYESGTKAALSGGTTMVVDFCIPDRNQPLMEAFADWDKRSKDARRRLFLPHVHHLLVRQGARGHGQGRRRRA